jgi:hypothetical protein
MTAACLLDSNILLRMSQRDILLRMSQRDNLHYPAIRATGVHVHDYSPSVSAGAIRATLAASMYFHNIPQILTINVRDFTRFRGLSILHPADVLHEPTP